MEVITDARVEVHIPDDFGRVSRANELARGHQ
jgi:hypothetical protein